MSGLSKEFRTKGGSVHALRSVELDFAEGKLTVLLGPSGCGKTTLLRCIAGLEEPTGGTIRLGARVLYDRRKHINIPTNRRNVGMVFQSYALWPHLTVARNIAFPLRRQGVAKQDVESRVSEALSLVHCEDLGGRYPAELSGGQQQRIALARAVVSKPDVLLFDEPLSNLDAELRVRMRTEIKKLQQQAGTTAIYVTHDQEEALALADQLVVMKDGGVLQRGSAQEIYDRPQSELVARFVGAANIVPILGVSEHGVVQTPLGDVSLGTSGGALSGGGRNPVLAIRKEDIRFKPDVAGADGNTFKAFVRVQEFQGDHRITVFQVNGTELIAKLAKEHVLAPGTECCIELPSDKCLVVG